MDEARPRAQKTAAARPPLDLPFLLRRTSELELLISGVLVVALLQLPTRLAAGFERLQVHLDEGGWMILWMAYVYLQLGILSLIAVLLIHLAGRAYWVGLIGLRSVFPQGIRWRRVTIYGPRLRAFYRARLPTVESLIRSTDAFCSSLFSIAFALALLFFLSIFVVLPLIGLTLLVDRRLFGGGHMLAVLYALLALLLVPPLILQWLDKRIPRRRRGDLLERLAHFVVRPFYYLTGAPLLSPISTTFLSNSRSTTFFGLLGGIMAALFVALLAGQLAGLGVLSAHDLRYVPSGRGERVLAAEHYRDQLEPAAVSTAPSIQSDVVAGPYLELFLPYVPRRHNRQIERACPQLKPLQKGGLTFRRGSRYAPQDDAERAAAERAAGCLAGLFEVELDRRPLTGLDFHFYRRPQSGVVGLLAHLPAGDLAPGKHVLRIRSRARPRGGGGEDGDALREHVIPFWR